MFENTHKFRSDLVNVSKLDSEPKVSLVRQVLGPPEDAPPVPEVNLAKLPKTGDIEIVLIDVVFSGHMMHWSTKQKYLAISDIWGQKYLHLSEKNDTKVESENEQAEESEDLDAPDFSAPDISAPDEPHVSSPGEGSYEIRSLTIPADVVYLIRPQESTEGAFPLMIPVEDVYNTTDNTDEVVVAFNDKLHLVSWDLEKESM